MSEIHLVSASAGSGKTFKLAYEYIKQLVNNSGSFRHILAVTFTNKATYEMKERILTALYCMSENKEHLYFNWLEADTSISLNRNQIVINAGKALQKILHNYTRFNIETIDSFFQHVIRSFTREIGINTGYRVELNTPLILQQAIDNLLQNTDNNKPLQSWLQKFTSEKIEQGKNWNIRKDLTDLGEEIFSEEYKNLKKHIQAKISDPTFLNSYAKNMYNLVNSFENKVAEKASEIMHEVHNNQLSVTDFSNKEKGVMGYIANLAAKRNIIPLSVRSLNALNAPEKWTSKTAPNKTLIKNLAEQTLNPLLLKIHTSFQQHYRSYKTALAVLSNLYTLGIMHQLDNEVVSITTEENSFLISDSAYFLHNIIDNNEAPFVYEKIGSYFKHFMIDEFQDTSQLQYSSFKPLLSNSLAEGNQNLVVGDIKQSIYRWRNSEWELLAHTVSKDFSQYIKSEVLGENYRSSVEIVNFNNSLFSFAAELVQNTFNNDTGQWEHENDNNGLNSVITSVYKHVNQLVPPKNKNKTGYIDIQLHPNDNDNEQLADTLVEHIKTAVSAGYKASDMAILVRTKAEGKLVVNRVLEEKESDPDFNVNVVSGESMFLHSSTAVLLSIAAFKYLLSPADRLNLFELKSFYSSLKSLSLAIVNERITNMLETLESKRSKNLYELTEETIQLFELSQHENEHIYLQKLLDIVVEYQERKGSDVYSFVKYWNDNTDKFSITPQENQDAISVLTIHKSKGLQYKVVFVPFCHWNLDFSSSITHIIWCPPRQSPFNEINILPVKYGKNLTDTFFESDYYTEKAKAFIDHLNLLYVAFTRAEEMLLVSGIISKPGKERKIKNMADVLTEFITSHAEADTHTQMRFVSGNIHKLVPPETTNPPPLLTPQFHTPRPLSQKIQLAFEGQDYFYNHESNKQSDAKFYGKLMHQLFESIVSIKNINTAINEFIFNGKLTSTEAEVLKHEIPLKIAANPILKQCFSGNDEVITENNIYTPEKEVYRPDRVNISDNNVLLLDYKFTHEMSEKDIKQLTNYTNLLKKMGYTNVQPYLWYYHLDNVVHAIT